jgi:hypothetical protein
MDNYCHNIQLETAESHAATTHVLARDMGYLSSPCHFYKGKDGNRYDLPTDKDHFMNAKGELLSPGSCEPPSSEWTSVVPSEPHLLDFMNRVPDFFVHSKAGSATNALIWVIRPLEFKRRPTPHSGEGHLCRSL